MIVDAEKDGKSHPAGEKAPVLPKWATSSGQQE